MDFSPSQRRFWIDFATAGDCFDGGRRRKLRLRTSKRNSRISARSNLAPSERRLGRECKEIRSYTATLVQLLRLNRIRSSSSVFLPSIILLFYYFFMISYVFRLPSRSFVTNWFQESRVFVSRRPGKTPRRGGHKYATVTNDRDGSRKTYKIIKK